MNEDKLKELEDKIEMLFPLKWEESRDLIKYVRQLEKDKVELQKCYQCKKEKSWWHGLCFHCAGDNDVTENKLKKDNAGKKDEVLNILHNLEETLGHYHCEDCWYTCPMHIDGCCNEDTPKKCNCIYEKQMLLIEELEHKVRQKD